jgi:hypothetical protein
MISFSLEQVPETGRWRFMNTSPKFELKIGEMTRHVRRVVGRILAASNLGVLQGAEAPYSSSYNDSVISSGGGGDAWDPDAQFSTRRSSGEGREWDVIVVNDSKTVNAQVVPGELCTF